MDNYKNNSVFIAIIVINMRTIAKFIVFLGALNWGFVGLSYFFEQNLNIINLLIGDKPMLEAIIYLTVTTSALYLVFSRKSF